MPERRITLTACLLAALAGLAAAVQGAEAVGQYQLDIRPSICVSYASDEPCGMTLRISWAGSGAGPVCLKTTDEDDWIQCWNGQSAGSLERAWEGSGDVVYQLVSMQNNAVLAEAEVRVISRDLRDSRRRRRHVWSIL